MEIEIKQIVEIDLVSELLNDPEGCEEFLNELNVFFNGTPAQIGISLNAGKSGEVTAVTRMITVDSLVDQFIEDFLTRERDYPEGIKIGTDILECLERNTTKLRLAITKTAAK